MNDIIEIITYVAVDEHLAVCGTRLAYTDKFGRASHRLFLIPSTRTEINKLYGRAILVGLTSIKRAFRRTAQITLFTPNSVIKSIAPVEGDPLMSRINQWMEYYESISMKPSGAIPEDLSSGAHNALKTHKVYDSGTIVDF